MKHIDPKPVRFALVGVGRIGLTHLDALSKVDNAILKALVEPRRAAGEAAAEQKQVRWFEDYRNPELLEMVDAVIITPRPTCTPKSPSTSCRTAGTCSAKSRSL